MTQEEKVKAYDEAIGRLEDIKTGKCQKTFMFTEGLFDYIFPELKESEDEKIREKIIATIHLYYGEPLEDEAKEMIAWLEKQGERVVDKKLSGLLNKVVCHYINDINIPYSERNEVSKKIIPYIEKLEKQGSGFLNNEEYQTVPVETLDRLYAAEKELEQLKQGKQKPVFEMKTPEESLGIDSDTYNKIVDECIYGEQKPADADLKDIVDKEANSIWKEINTGGGYSIIDSFNQFYGICMQVAEAVVDCKKPTEWIQELESKLSNATPEQLAEWKEKYFKVEPVLSEDDETVLDNLIYALANDRIGNDRDEYISWLNSLKDRVLPQSKQEWSEEDEKILNSLISSLTRISASTRTDSTSINYTFSKEIDLLKSIKDKVQPQQEILEKLEEWLDKYVSDLADVDTASLICSFTNYLDGKLPKSLKDRVQPNQEWSKEDEKMFLDIESLIHSYRTGSYEYELSSWLKSIRHQNTWKPSEEQMNALENAIRYGEEESIGILSLLYNDLKKLMEE